LDHFNFSAGFPLFVLTGKYTNLLFLLCLLFFVQLQAFLQSKSYKSYSEAKYIYFM